MLHVINILQPQKFVHNTTQLTDGLCFGMTVCRYKQRLTFGVINLLHDQNC